MSVHDLGRASSTPVAGTGRPRDNRLTETIVDSARELVFERGYDHLRMKDVAKHAGTGIDTVYRRWSSKAELFADVLRSTPPIDHRTVDGPATDLRSDVMELAQALQDWSSYYSGLAAAAREHPVLGQAVAENLKAQVDSFADKIAGIAGESGSERIGLAAEAIMAVLAFRAAFTGDAIEPEELTDELIRAALAIAGPG